MFNKDFYPTPEWVIEQMIFDLDLSGKIVLEPSAGSGAILDKLNQYNARTLACEKNKDLASIAANKANEFVGSDFFNVTSQDISHIDFMIMNPPFSNGEKHIIHAFDIAPGGCQIVSLCNTETLHNRFSMYRKSLKSYIDEFGNSEYIGNVFTQAERKTDVEVSIVRLWKLKSNENEFEGYFDLEEKIEEGDNEEGIMSYNSVREIVNRYVGAVKMFDEVMAYNKKINNLIEPINVGDHPFQFGCYRSGDNVMRKITRNEFKRKLQRSAWEGVFRKLDMDKYVTSSVMEDINKFVEKQQNVPFTMKNVYKMLEIIIGTHGERMEKIIVQAFDEITKHHHDNRYYKEGWKTNDQYRVGKKFILPNIITIGFRGQIDTNWIRGRDTMNDIHKALCYVTGTNFNKTESFHDFVRKDRREFGELYEWGFFKIRCYKKGTIHCTFKDEWTWDEFNKVACKAKGFHLAEKYTSDYRKKSNKPERSN